MSVTCGYDADAQHAVERGAERFPVFCKFCEQRIPFHYSADRLSQLEAEVKALTNIPAVKNLYNDAQNSDEALRIRPDIAQAVREADLRRAHTKDLGAKAKAHMASLSKEERDELISSLKAERRLAMEARVRDYDHERPKTGFAKNLSAKVRQIDRRDFSAASNQENSGHSQAIVSCASEHGGGNQ